MRPGEISKREVRSIKKIVRWFCWSASSLLVWVMIWLWWPLGRMLSNNTLTFGIFSWSDFMMACIPLSMSAGWSPWFILLNPEVEVVRFLEQPVCERSLYNQELTNTKNHQLSLNTIELAILNSPKHMFGSIATNTIIVRMSRLIIQLPQLLSIRFPVLHCRSSQKDDLFLGPMSSGQVEQLFMSMLEVDIETRCSSPWRGLYGGHWCEVDDGKESDGDFHDFDDASPLMRCGLVFIVFIDLGRVLLTFCFAIRKWGLTFKL